MEPIAHRGFRDADAATLACQLVDSRAATLRHLEACAEALGPGLRVPLRDSLNLPLWEAGHVAWFQAVWTARLPAAERHRGEDADPEVPRHPPPPVDSPLDDDALHDSSRVPHARRWSLPLPGLAATRDALARALDGALDALARAPADEAGLYFSRLVLAHEDMHQEAGLMLAQQLGLPREDLGPPAPPPAPPRRERAVAAGPVELGLAAGTPGFAFDNERGRRAVALAGFRIDTEVVRQGDYLAFVEAGGLDEPRLWSAEGWAWRQACAAAGLSLPRDLRRDAGGGWSRRVFAGWRPAEPRAPMQQVSAFEAEAWCRWAGRRLPTEAEWWAAARQPPEAGFRWGEVWEWTACAFQPFEGFRPHPYRDYSAPWFGDHRVLRGAAWTTPPRLRNLRFRNFYRPGRQDVFAGFRSCAA